MDSNDIIIIKKLNELISDNDVLVDIGANNGVYTEYFNNQTNNTSKIYSVELHPDTFNVLNNRFNKNSNILLFNNAVCDKNEMIDFYAGNDSCTNNIIGHDMSFKPNNKVGQIQGITIDELLKNENKIKLIKVDVEGAELSVLKGMVNTFHKLDYLLIECHLDEHWDDIKPILLNNFECENAITGELITDKSNRHYQCLCKKK
jgi:FkbM family methyltransferase